MSADRDTKSEKGARRRGSDASPVSSVPIKITISNNDHSGNIDLSGPLAAPAKIGASESSKVAKVNSLSIFAIRLTRGLR
jgi:hypothetical protein